VTTERTLARVVAFLDGEKRQVWALHRESGEPFFLPEGRATELRGFTKSSLRCPHPDCTVEISTRGGSKRDHFLHVTKPTHETGRESEFHLAGKAMLMQWAALRIPDGATVHEERTVKDPATSLLRRADVMVTGRSGRQVAYEVEYKSYAIEAWQAKQADYDAQGIACAWLIGHTKVRLATGPSSPDRNDEAAVRLPELAAVIARAGHPVMVVNPATRQIGTLAGSARFDERYRGASGAWLAVDDLDDCEFSPHGGIITPTLRRIVAAEEEVARELAREEAQEAEARHRMSVFRGDDLRAWEHSPLRATFLARWGTIPDVLARDAGATGGVLAVLPLWHGAIYEELLHQRTVDFKWREVFAALDRHGIRRHSDTKLVFRTLMAWLQAMEALGLLRFHRDRQRRVLLFSPAGLTLDEATRAAAQRRLDQAAAEDERMSAAERHREEAARIKAERERVLEERRGTALRVSEAGSRRWAPK
jgi:hypothetical protein